MNNRPLPHYRPSSTCDKSGHAKNVEAKKKKERKK